MRGHVHSHLGRVLTLIFDQWRTWRAPAQSCPARPIQACGFRALLRLCVFVGRLSGCGTDREAPITIRLVDQFDQAVVQGAVPFEPPSPLEWRFDGKDSLAVPGENAQTHGWRAISGTEGLSVREGLLVGRTSGDETPTLSATLPDNLEEDFLYAVEIRMRVSEGTQVGVWLGPSFEPVPTRARREHYPWAMVSVPLEPGAEFRTYRLTNDAQTFPLGEAAAPANNRFTIRHVQVEPTDATGTEFAIESIRLVTRREHLRSISSGPGWQALGYIERETIVSRSPERVRFEVELGSHPWLDLAVGSVEDGPVTFTGKVGAASTAPKLFRRTLTLPGHWEPMRLDLSDFAGQQITLELGLEAEDPGRLGFWGAPVIRHSGVFPRAVAPSPARAALPDSGSVTPQGVIVILADTLRNDRLDAYGHDRPTESLSSEQIRRLRSLGYLQ